MTPGLKILLITIVLLALAISGIAIKMFLKKGGEFKKQCSSVDPETGERFGCTCGAADDGTDCENKSDHHHEVKIKVAELPSSSHH